jgi:hypothetical protein
MARMVPPYPPSETKSYGERQVFDLLKTSPETSDWTSLHSLGISKHITQQYGEVDFVVMVPGEGVFCLEVKSGSVFRRDGLWIYTNMKGEETTSPSSPFRQAQNGMFSLLKTVQRRLGQDHPLSKKVFGCGVIFPHVAFKEQDTEYEPWQICDKESLSQSIVGFLKRLSKNTHQLLQSKSWYSADVSRPTKEDIDALLDIFRGDFERILKPRDAISISDDILIKLTEEQYRRLDELELNDRCLLEGGAGTGKTLLAIELAKRKSISGSRVLLVCYNRMLGRWLDSTIKELGAGMTEAWIFHDLMLDIINKSSLLKDYENEIDKADGSEIFEQIIPIYAEEAMNEGVLEPFDYLIIDEGQDLIKPEYLNVLDRLLKGGLKEGGWSIFRDFQRQAIFNSDATPESMVELIKERSYGFARCRLTVNCRNTQEIGKESYLISGANTNALEFSRAAGTPVEYCFFEDCNDQREMIKGLLTRLIKNERIPVEWITLLSFNRWDKSCLPEIEHELPAKVTEIARAEIFPYLDKTITFSTIHAFKGLENKIVIITDIAQIESEYHRKLLYVGMTRARQRLYLFMSESSKGIFEKIKKACDFECKSKKKEQLAEECRAD